MSFPRLSEHFIRTLIVGGALGFIAWLVIPKVNGPVPGSPRASDRADLGVVGKSRIIYETDHPNGMPPKALTDVYAYATEMARSGVLMGPQFWLSHIDPALNATDLDDIHSIINPATKLINPKLQGAALAFAVALLPKVSELPPTTPIAWTRGLQPDGTWRKDNPYGGKGGDVVFAAGNVQQFANTTGAFMKWGTHEPTSNIQEALPPGTRIGEYVPPAH